MPRWRELKRFCEQDGWDRLTSKEFANFVFANSFVITAKQTLRHFSIYKVPMYISQ